MAQEGHARRGLDPRSVLLQVGGHHPPAGIGEGGANGAADAARPPGDKGHPPVEPRIGADRKLGHLALIVLRSVEGCARTGAAGSAVALVAIGEPAAVWSASPRVLLLRCFGGRAFSGDQMRRN